MTAPTIAWPINPSRDEDVVNDITSPLTTSTVRRDEFDYKCDMEIYMIKYKKAMREEEEWETCSDKVYNFLLIHCPPDLEEVLKTVTNWDSVSASENSMRLLAMIRDVSYDNTGAKQTVMTFVELTIELFIFCQQVGMSNDEFAIMFKAYVEALTAHGVTPWHHPALMQKHWDLLLAARMLVETQMSADREVKVAKELEAEARKIEDDKFLACLFVIMADSKQYWELKLKLSNTFVFGGGDYLKNLTESLDLLNNFNP